MATNIKSKELDYPILSVLGVCDIIQYWSPLTIESKISAISDTLDFVYFIMQCEKTYDVVIHDNEADLFNQLRLLDLHDLILLIKGEGECTGTLSIWITTNFDIISKGRKGFYDCYTRDYKLKVLIDGERNI